MPPGSAPTKPKAGTQQTTPPPPPAYGTSWEQQFLKDIGAPDSQSNVQFMNAWINREGAAGFANNPLATMQQGFGGVPGTNGIMSYPDMTSGAAADAKALENGRYGDVLGALRAGNADPNANYPSLGVWSGGGYTSLKGSSLGNPAAEAAAGSAIAGNNAQTGLLQDQQALNAAMAQINSQFATQEAQYSNQNLGISQAQLGIQRGQLGRLAQEYPALHKLQGEQNTLSLQGMRENLATQKEQYGLQTGQIQQNYAQQFKDMMSQGAGSGTLFTAGHRDQTALAHQTEKTTLAEMRSQMLSAEKGEARQERGLGLSEQTQNVQFAEQMSALKDQQKNLDLLALRYGVSANEIKTRLDNTILQMGVSAGETAASLAQQIAALDTNSWAAANSGLAISPQPFQTGAGMPGSSNTYTPPTITTPGG